MKNFLAEGYREDEKLIKTHPNAQEHYRRLFICPNKNLIFAKTNISDATNKNLTILEEDIQRIPENHMFDEIYLVGDVFYEMEQDILEELKLKCYEVWTIEEENFDKENILKEFTNKK